MARLGTSICQLFLNNTSLLENDSYPLCLEQYLVLFMQCINSLQRDLVVYRV